jgi:hypothetical protein
MARYYRQQRPAFVTVAMQDQANRELDSRLAQQDLEWQARFNAAADAELSGMTTEEIGAEAATQAELDAARTADYERHQAWLDRRRAERDHPFSTMGT